MQNFLSSGEWSGAASGTLTGIRSRLYIYKQENSMLYFAKYRSSLYGVLSLTLIAFCANAQTDQDRELWYRTPANEWTDAMPVGNGRLGAMVFGPSERRGARGLREQIHLNEESVWAGSKVNNNNPAARQNLSAIQQAVFNGEHRRVWEMADKYLLGTPPRIRSYQPLGELSIHYLLDEVQPSGYRRSLNLNSGVSRTEFTVGGNRFVQEVYASAPHDVIVVTLQATRPFDLDVMLTRDRDTDVFRSEGEMAWFEGQIRDEESPLHGPGGRHMRFSAGMKVHLVDGRIDPLKSDTSAGYAIRQARNISIIVTGATDYKLDKLDTDPSVEPLAICRQLLTQAAKNSTRRLRQRHEADHRKMFERVQFNMGDPRRRLLPTDERIKKVREGGSDKDLITLYYQYGRYLLMGSSRKPGRLPANLQ